MKRLTNWFIAAFVGIVVFSSCVDQIKFGDNFLEKAPDTGDMNQDTILEKLNMRVLFCGALIAICITDWLRTGTK